MRRCTLRPVQKPARTQGFACPNPDCAYCGITDDSLHTLIGYGKPNHIQRFQCRSCGKTFTSRLGMPLYRLKTEPQQVEMVMWFIVDASVMSRYTGHCDATIAGWWERMVIHSQHIHNLFFRELIFTVLQIDELYTRVRGIASARWLWLAIDPVSKAIPTLHIGARTKEDAFAVAHDVKQRWAYAQSD